MSLSERFGRTPAHTLDGTSPSAPQGSDESAPQTDAELHEYIVSITGKSIPRRAVCSHHVAPFTFFADAYFARRKAILALAPRAGGKTWMLGLLLYLRCKLAFHKIKTLIVASVEQQASECYSHVVDFIHDDPDGNADAESLKTITKFPNRSELKYITGSVKSIRGQHPSIAALDEVDEFDQRTLEVALLCAAGDEKQNILASTKQYAHGTMQKLEDEIRAAEADDGANAPYNFYSWCLLDCMAPVPECGTTCGCERVKKGRNEDGSDRTFAEVCAGRLKDADGWINLDEAWSKFRSVDKATFNAEMLCMGANTEGLIVPSFNRNLHVLRGYQPLPHIGPIYTSSDLGDTNPTATLWVQFVAHADGAKVKLATGEARVLPFGSYVVFGEIYKARWSAQTYTDAIKERERDWRFTCDGFRVRERYFDAQAAPTRREWSERGIQLVNYAPKQVAFQTKKVRELVEDDRLFIDQSAENLIAELESWTYDPKLDGIPLKQTGTQDHAVDALRYAVANMLVRLHEAKSFDKPGEVVAFRGPVTAASDSPWQTSLEGAL